MWTDGTAGPKATRPNEGWSLDFLHDTLLNRRWFRALNVMDDCTREQLALEPEFSFSSGQVIRVLDALAFERSYPRVLRVDQGPELTSLAMLRWAAEHDVILQFSDPGKPTQNAHIESLNGRVRDELFNVNCYRNLAEVREAAAAWRYDYNHTDVPHVSLPHVADLERQRAVDPDELPLAHAKTLAHDQNPQTTTTKAGPLGRDRIHRFDQCWVVGTFATPVLHGAPRATGQTASRTFTHADL